MGALLFVVLAQLAAPTNFVVTPGATIVETPCPASDYIADRVSLCGDSFNVSTGVFNPLAIVKWYGTGAVYGLSCPIARIYRLTDARDGVDFDLAWIYWRGSTDPATLVSPGLSVDPGVGLPLNWFGAMNFNVPAESLRVTYTSTDPTCHP